jgi:hypothetical protein
MDWEEEEEGEEQADESRMILGLAHQEQWPGKQIGKFWELFFSCHCFQHLCLLLNTIMDSRNVLDMFKKVALFLCP